MTTSIYLGCATCMFVLASLVLASVTHFALRGVGSWPSVWFDMMRQVVPAWDAIQSYQTLAQLCNRVYRNAFGLVALFMWCISTLISMMWIHTTGQVYHYLDHFDRLIQIFEHVKSTRQQDIKPHTSYVTGCTRNTQNFALDAAPMALTMIPSFTTWLLNNNYSNQCAFAQLNDSLS